jgi:aspartate 1-decarboxylase
LGDLIIAVSGQLPVDQLAVFQPKLVWVDGTNRIKEARTSIPVPGQQLIQHVYRFKEQQHVQRF